MKLLDVTLTPSDFKKELYTGNPENYQNCSHDEIRTIYQRYVDLYKNQNIDSSSSSDELLYLENLIGDYHRHAYSIQARFLCRGSISGGEKAYFLDKKQAFCLYPRYIDIYIQCVPNTAWIHEQCPNIPVFLLRDNRVCHLKNYLSDIENDSDKHQAVIERLTILRTLQPHNDWSLIFQILDLETIEHNGLVQSIITFGTDVLYANQYSVDECPLLC